MSKMTIDEVYAQIDEQREVLIGLLNISSRNPIPPNRLSDVCMKLSILNELLGGFLSDLKADQLEAEKLLFEQGKQSGSSDTGSMAQARMGTIEKRRVYDKADTKHSDLWKLISMAQTHIGAEREERKGL